MNVYFLSGLGADKRVFQKLILPSEYNIIHIDWIDPLKNETIQEYALRLIPYIDSSKPFYLVGLSFGGIMATELSKILSPVQTIIISSISKSGQLPWHLKIYRHIPIYKYLPESFLKSANSVTYWLFGVNTIEEKKFLQQILTDTDIHFLRWAIGTILKWNNKAESSNLFHMHGSSDNIFPIGVVKPDKVILNGGHFMIYNQADEVSEILTNTLRTYP